MSWLWNFWLPFLGGRHKRIAASSGDSTSPLRQDELLEFFDLAPVGFFSVDHQGRFRMVNRVLAGWLECQPEELIEQGWQLHQILAEPPHDKAPYDLGSEGGLIQHVDVILIGVKGRRFPASITQTVVVGGDGVPLRTRAVVRDLVPEHEWREALRLSEHRFQGFFEQAPIGIALADVDGSLTICNPAFQVMIGVSAEGLSRRPLNQLLHPDDRQKVHDHLQSVLASGDAVGPLEIRLAGEKEQIFHLYARRLGGGLEAGFGGDGARLILHFIDMTEQKSLEAQFVQSRKMQAIGQLAGGIAHDFNNLLTAMTGFCDLLLLCHRPGDPSFADIMQIKQNANRAANLVRQLLAFSRQQTLSPRVIDITDVLSDLANLLRRLIGEHIDLRLVHGRDLGLVKSDSGQLEQVIINLVVNARDAMPGGGRLTISTSNHTVATLTRHGHDDIPAGDYVVIDVADTGIGILRENLERIFEPFFTTKEAGSGTGLGLSTVYGIVRQTGGFIFVDSTPGTGTRFTIYLPRHFGPDPSSQVVTPEPRDLISVDLTGTETILLVEDEDAVRVFGARALRNKGYRVLEAKSGEAALQWFEPGGERIDLLITDVVMPLMDGPTLIRHVRKQHPDLKVIFISGYTEDRCRDQLDEGQSVHFLPKPFSLKQLAGKVREVLHDGN
ncbi:two-component system, cell cycle sensor histidine kinase and response regulator CckA [uncultured Gammaproteobacteria bacterium]